MTSNIYSSRILCLNLLFSWFRTCSSFSLFPALFPLAKKINCSTSARKRRMTIFYVVDDGDTRVGTVDISRSVDTLDSSYIFPPPSSSSFDGDTAKDVTRRTRSCFSSVDASGPFFASVVEKQQQEYSQNKTNSGVTRRDVFQRGALLFFGGAVIGNAILDQGPTAVEPSEAKGVTMSSRTVIINKKVGLPIGAVKQPMGSSTGTAKQIAPVNLTKVVAETAINVMLDCDVGCVSVDSKKFTKIQTTKVPAWYPTFLTPPPKVIKEITNSELLVAATVAGAATEMFRTSLLYPLQTIKTRIQTDVHNFTVRPPRMEDRLVNLGNNIRRHVEEGDLYAGITPSLLISVPATGVYYGIRDVTKRVLAMTPFLNDVQVLLIAALVADVISLCFRTPADALALRLQDQSRNVGDWFHDSLKRLPAVIITDLPYLLSKILLARQFIHGTLSIDRYAEYAIISAIVAAFLTTPFDVGRTRILIDSDKDFPNGIDGGSGEGVIRTMIAISKEGKGGIANLFAGWFERVLYLGVGRAWLEPIQIIAYVGIRDAILLEWF